ncbi:hypothetical protein N7457_008630 [Penicillium paradoxum]|uniref:uncharacterized protein n=1 Tax=Penicillium paradoxum TaxID=176176 RepID=UPI002548CBE4|nr:uncharacterized protein N7457_008630 [Penicillium paradoxum]KAJ5773734.1 hypothetical protein N7457_008630 [Penicillium paradoxum]
MVSFWPWKGDDNSAASFEKTLSTLSTKIAQATAQLDQDRQSSRRFKALWTLYSTFAYLFYSIILALVLGWESWGVKEYAAIAGGPILIYTVRKTGVTLFEYRISRIQQHLDDYNKQREETIEKLKIATKYNSTQQLLEKYGGGSPKPSPGPKADGDKRQPPQEQQHAARTGLPPPPTANIRPRSFSSLPPTTQPFPYSPSPPLELAQGGHQPQQQQQYPPSPFPPSTTHRPIWLCAKRIPSKWGIHRTTTLAPPGIKTPEELGRWRCGSCRAWNGVESEATRILTSLRQNSVSAERTWEPVSPADADNQSSEGTEEGVMVASSSEEQTEASGSEVENYMETTREEESPTAPVRRSKRTGK